MNVVLCSCTRETAGEYEANQNAGSGLLSVSQFQFTNCSTYSTRHIARWVHVAEYVYVCACMYLYANPGFSAQPSISQSLLTYLTLL